VSARAAERQALEFYEMGSRHKAWRILFVALAMLAAGTFGASIMADVVQSLVSYAGLSEID
jgi:hypothetical protein